MQGKMNRYAGVNDVRKQRRQNKRIVIIVVIAVTVVAGLMAACVLTSPQMALSRIARDVNQNGMTALEPYLTGEARIAYDKVKSIIQNPIAGFLMKTTNADGIVNALASAGKGNLKMTYLDVSRGWMSANVRLNLQTPAANGDIELQMAQKGFAWKIRDISIPIGSWLFTSP